MTKPAPIPGLTGIEHIGLRVEDIEATVADLAARGIPLVSGITDIRPGLRIAFFEGPDGVRIDVTERQAVAVVRIGGLLRGMDAGGVVFRSYRQAPVGLPSVTTGAGTSAEALAEAAAVVTSLPQEVAVKVDHIDVRSVDAISLVLRDGRTVEWGSSSQSQQKAEVLGVLLRQQAQVYDVSVPSRPTTRG